MGDTRGVTEELIARVYHELRSLAAHYVRRHAAGSSLQATALVHEAYLRLARASSDWQNEAHFRAVAALAMRQVVADRARRRRAHKRGGALQRVTLTTLPGAEAPMVDVLALDDALRKLGESDERQARIVVMRLLGGLTVAEVAEALGVSERTVQLDWRRARAWIVGELGLAAADKLDA